jgi:hypothetical protein
LGSRGRAFRAPQLARACTAHTYRYPFHPYYYPCRLSSPPSSPPTLHIHHQIKQKSKTNLSKKEEEEEEEEKENPLHKLRIGLPSVVSLRRDDQEEVCGAMEVIEVLKLQRFQKTVVQ